MTKTAKQILTELKTFFTAIEDGNFEEILSSEFDVNEPSFQGDFAYDFFISKLKNDVKYYKKFQEFLKENSNLSEESFLEKLEPKKYQKQQDIERKAKFNIYFRNVAATKDFAHYLADVLGISNHYLLNIVDYKQSLVESIINRTTKGQQGQTETFKIYSDKYEYFTPEIEKFLYEFFQNTNLKTVKSFKQLFENNFAISGENYLEFIAQNIDLLIEKGYTKFVVDAKHFEKFNEFYQKLSEEQRQKITLQKIDESRDLTDRMPKESETRKLLKTLALKKEIIQDKTAGKYIAILDEEKFETQFLGLNVVKVNNAYEKQAVEPFAEFSRNEVLISTDELNLKLSEKLTLNSRILTPEELAEKEKKLEEKKEELFNLMEQNGFKKGVAQSREFFRIQNFIIAKNSADEKFLFLERLEGGGFREISDVKILDYFLEKVNDFLKTRSEKKLPTKDNNQELEQKKKQLFKLLEKTIGTKKNIGKEFDSFKVNDFFIFRNKTNDQYSLFEVQQDKTLNEMLDVNTLDALIANAKDALRERLSGKSSKLTQDEETLEDVNSAAEAVENVLAEDGHKESEMQEELNQASYEEKKGESIQRSHEGKKEEPESKVQEMRKTLEAQTQELEELRGKMQTQQQVIDAQANEIEDARSAILTMKDKAVNDFKKIKDDAANKVDEISREEKRTTELLLNRNPRTTFNTFGATSVVSDYKQRS